MSGGAGTCSGVGLSRDVLRCRIEQRHAQVCDRAEICPGVGWSRDMLRCIVQMSKVKLKGMIASGWCSYLGSNSQGSSRVAIHCD